MLEDTSKHEEVEVPPKSTTTTPLSPQDSQNSRNSRNSQTHTAHNEAYHFYQTPTALYAWEEEQHSRHAEWSDLFFDVIYVGVCYQAGSLLLDDQGKKEYTISLQSFGLFLAVFWCSYYGWESRLLHKAHLKFQDRFHSTLHVFQGLLIAVATRSLDKEIDKTSNNSLALIFSSALLIHCTIDLGITLEIMLLATHRPTRRFAKLYMLPANVLRVGLLVASIISVTFQADFALTLVLWIASYVIPSSVRFWTTVVTRKSIQDSIPSDAGYMIQRYGEWTMLVLGEGVIQVVLAEATYDVEYFGNVAMSYILMALLQLLHYSINPFIPVDHAISKSSTRAVLWIELQLVYNTLLLLIGITVKLGFKEKTSGFDWFLCGFTSVSVVLLFIQHLLHLGVRKELGIVVVPFRRLLGRDSSKATENSSGCFLTRSFLCFRFTQGFQQKRTWVAKVLVSCGMLLIPLFGISESRTALLTLLVNIFLLVIIVFQIVSGAFKRDRKLVTTLATVKAVAKFKALLTNKDKSDENQLETGRTLESEGEIASTQSDKSGISLLTSGKENGGKTLVSTSASSGQSTVLHVGHQLTNRAKSHGKAKVKKIKSVLDRVKAMNLYDLPMNQVDWEHLEHDHETDWADLFFDLSYVALLLKLGNIFTGGFLTEHAVHVEVWLFVSLFITTYDCWISKTYYSSSVTSTDFFHKALDIFEGLLVTLLAASIPQFLGIEAAEETNSTSIEHHRRLAEENFHVNEKQFALAFSTLRLLTQIVHVFRFAEVYFFAPEDMKRLKAFGRKNGLRQFLSLIPTLISFAPAAFLTADDGRSTLLAVTALCWVMGYFMKTWIVGYEIFRRKLQNRNTIPIHLEVYLHRYGEWVILMFGVCVLSLIIKDAGSDKKQLEEWVDFVFAFLVVSIFRKLHCEVERFNPACHAARFSRIRGWTWGALITPLSIAIVSIGYALAAIEVNFQRGWDTGDLFWAFAGASAIYFEVLWVLDWLHVGPDEWVFVTKYGRTRRAAVLFVKCIAIPAVFFAFPPTTVSAYIVLLVAILQAVASWWVHHIHEKQRIEEHVLLEEKEAKQQDLESVGKDEASLGSQSPPRLVRQSSLTSPRRGIIDENVVEDELGGGGVLVDL